MNGRSIRSLRNHYHRLSQKPASDLNELLQQYLSLEALEEATERNRAWPSPETACTFLRQVLNPRQPCREAVRASNIARITGDQPQVSDNTSAYCQARRKLPEPLLEQLWKNLGNQLDGSVRKSLFWKGRRVGIVDGSSLSMPDTPQNQKLYPQPSEQKPGCGFPVVKIVAVFSLLTGAVRTFIKGDLSLHERTMFHQLWDDIVALYDLLIGDRGFCAFADMFLLKQKGVDTVFRLHQARRVNWRKGKRLGKHDRLVKWMKPVKPPEWLTPEQIASLPEVFTVRIVKIQIRVPGFRTQSIIVATTLLDPIEFSAEDIAELYFMRWSVELFFRHNKTTMAMDVLRCLSPAMIHREIHMHWIAYNLIRSIMFEAAQQNTVPADRISLKGTADTLRQWLPALHAAANKPRIFNRIYRKLLATLARDTVPLRPNRSEPRAIKRRPKKFHLLNKPRHLMGNLPHKNRSWHRKIHPLT